jgi:hypothetical protein
MNLSKISLLLAAGLLASLSVQAQDAFQPVPSVANPYVAHGGNALGRARALNDLELTAISRATESVEVQMAKAASARTELVDASLNNPATLQAKVQVLADAEYQLALARADAYGKLKVDLKATTPARAVAIQNALTSTSTGRGGGGGGAAAAAPAARGN